MYELMLLSAIDFVYVFPPYDMTQYNEGIGAIHICIT